MRVWRAALLLAVSAALNACAGLAGPHAIDESAQRAAQARYGERAAQLTAVQAFELKGRIAVTGAPLSGNLRWAQQPQGYELRITGPFGAGALLLQGEGQRVRIRNKDVDLVTDQPEQLLAEQTGWRLPLGALRYWVLGIPAPGAAAELQVDEQGRVVHMEQLGWALSYSDYRSGTPITPGRIEAKQGEWSALAIVQSLSLDGQTVAP